MHSENTMQLRPKCNFNLEEHMEKITFGQIIHSTSSYMRNLAELFPSKVESLGKTTQVSIIHVNWKNLVAIFFFTSHTTRMY